MYNKEYYQKNKEAFKRRQKKYDLKHIEKKKETAKKYRLKNREKLYEYTREWKKKNRKKCNEYLKEWISKNRKRYYLMLIKRLEDNPDKLKSKKEQNKKWRNNNKEAIRLHNKRYYDKNKDKVRARWASVKALNDGKLMPKNCEKCGETKVEIHHDDYTKPLKVRWLCRKCHLEYHTAKNMKEKYNIVLEKEAKERSYKSLN